MNQESSKVELCHIPAGSSFDKTRYVKVPGIVYSAYHNVFFINDKSYYNIPYEVADFIHKFDHKEPVKPFEFVLDLGDAA